MQPVHALSRVLQRRERVHQRVRGLNPRTRLDAVASRCDCSKQILYPDFGRKHALLRSVMQHPVALSTARLDDSHNDMRAILRGFAIAGPAAIATPASRRGTPFCCWFPVPKP